MEKKSEKIRIYKNGYLKNEAKIALADFETAIAASGFGKFNIILFLLSIPGGWSAVFETTTMSYVFPAAQCDLKLTLDDKGLLNSITFAGMITSAFVWGFLSDAFGRKKLLVIGFFLDGFFMILSSFSQNVPSLMASKFFGGIIVNGPSAAIITYMSEFHGNKYRSKMTMFRNIIIQCGNITIPLLAWVILPRDINFSNKYFAYHSWNLYLLVCSLPSLISGIIFVFLPETPKFLMTIGEKEKALEIFRMVYQYNTSRSPESFPIKDLIIAEGTVRNKTSLQSFKDGIKELKSLFSQPHLSYILLLCIIQISNKASLNPLKLWLPQIFQAINDYQYFNNNTNASLCTMLEVLKPSNTTTTCAIKLSRPFVYVGNMVASAVCIIGYTITGFTIHMLGEKLLLHIFGFITGTLIFLIYFAKNAATTLTLASLAMAFGGICSSAVITVTIDLFPTRLRAMAVSLVMSSNRFGSMIGNIFFPLLLKLGCSQVFFSMGFAMTGSTLLTYLLPNTDYAILE